jgi:hypothetical protein
MNDFSAVEQIRVSPAILGEGQLFLRKAGAAGCEGMVLWTGKADGKVFHVTQLLIPQQRGLRTKDGVCVVVDAAEMHRINVHLFQSGLRLIAQVHSHPTHAYHSDTDDQYAIATTTGAFSLVVPDFAVRPFSLSDCAIYRLARSGQWNEVPPARVHTIFIVEDK